MGVIHELLKITLLYPQAKVVTGYQNYADRLIKGLKLTGIETEVFPVRKKEISIMGKPFMGTASQLIFSKLINPTGDVVHSLTPNVIVKKTDVVTLHDLIPIEMASEFSASTYTRRGNEILFEKIKGVRHIIVFSTLMEEQFNESFPDSRATVHVVPQSIDHMLFYREVDESLKKSGRHLIVTVGDLNPRKKYELLFEALGGNEKYEVVHIGPVNAWEQNRKRLESIASRFDNIRMVGSLDTDSLRRYLSSADLLVHLSASEGFGSTPIEAMACGTNVVVSDLPIFRETVSSFGTFCSLEIDDIRRKIDTAIENKLSPEKLIDHSNMFSIKKMAEETVKVYSQILDTK